MTIFPSGASASAMAHKSSCGWKPGSKLPSGFSRARCVRGTPWTLVNAPAISALHPLHGHGMDVGVRPAARIEAQVQTAVRVQAATWGRAMPLKLVNAPTTRIFPSGCTRRRSR